MRTSLVIFAMLLIGCASQRDISTIESFGGLVVPAPDPKHAISLPVDSISFDPQKQQIDDDTFESLMPLLRKLPMQRLNISGQPITDASIDRINQLKSIRVLEINGTKITLAGLSRLRLPNLEQVNLSADAFDESELMELPASLRRLR